MRWLLTVPPILLPLLLIGATDSQSVIPAGTARIGAWSHTAEPAQADEQPRRRVFVAAFAIDRTEVTRSAYAACIASGRCAAREDVRAGDLLSSLPMTQVSWREADAYCRALGERLPSEVEWERAARGPDGTRAFPWGDEPDCSRGNWGNYEGEGRCPENPGRVVAVGSYPRGASVEGVLDLAGNVWEWTADVYAKQRGPEELGDAQRRSVRGGGCCSVLALPRNDNRVGFPEDYRDVDLGFRCAR